MRRKLWNYIKKRKAIMNFCSKLFTLVMGNTRRKRGNGNQINTEGAFLKNTNILISGNNNTIVVKNGAVLINTVIHIIGDNHILEIGESCVIKKSGFSFENSGCQIKVGDFTTAEGIQVAALEYNTSVIIGDDCMFSAGISIRNSDSHSIICKNSNARLNKAEDISIGNHTWIGEGVKILKGVNIGSDSIVGLGSIVTHDIPNNSIAVGVPAKVTRSDVTWSRERI